MSGATPVADELAQSLASAIMAGLTEQAKTLAAQMSELKVKCEIRLAAQEGHNLDTEFSLKVQVEDQHSDGCFFKLSVKASDTIADLKRKVMLLYHFPTEVQHWIIGKKIQDDNMRLHQCGVTKGGYTVYLYLVSASSVGLSRAKYEAQLQAIKLMRQQSGASSVMPLVSSSSGAAISSSPSSLTPPASVSTSLPPKDQKSLDSTKSIVKNNSLPGSKHPPFLPSSPGALRLQEMLQSTDQTYPVMTTSHATNLSSPIDSSVLMHTSSALTPEPWASSAVASSPHHTPRSDSPLDSGKTTVLVDNETPQVGWQCPVCTYINLPLWPGCEICNRQRPDDYKVPENYVKTERELRLLQDEQMLERLTREEIQEADQNRAQNYSHLLATENLDLIPNPEPFQCAICFDDILTGEGIVLRECIHMFCRNCLSEAVRHCEDAILTCPYQDSDYSCRAALQEREIRALVPEELFHKYLQRGLDQAEVQMHNSYHCKEPNCTGWCIYEDLVNFFRCPVCNQVNCLTCKAIHMGKNCQEYQEHLRLSAANDETARQTHQMLQALVSSGEAMHCPQCRVIVQKKGGCDWICCSICKTEICWVTKGPRWGPKGSGDTSGGCQCRVGGKRCHPQCQNCH